MRLMGSPPGWGGCQPVKVSRWWVARFNSSAKPCSGTSLRYSLIRTLNKINYVSELSHLDG